MDFDVYVAARRGRLIERAIELGSPEELAAEQVDTVLAAERKQIQKAADPDPDVHQALERALTGEPVGPGRGRPLAVAALATVALGAAVAVTYEAPPTTAPVPSLFGYQAAAAETLLESKGYEVVLEPSPVCEPKGQVLGTWPRTGEPVKEGASVTVYTAVPSGFLCAVYYLDRQDAWDFVNFALGGPAPEFSDPVYVVVDGSVPAALTDGEAERHARWGGTLQLVVDAARGPSESGTRMPRLNVTSGKPSQDPCAEPRPADAGERTVLRLQIDPRRFDDDSGCPLTIDLYRDDRVIDSVVFHTGRR